MVFEGRIETTFQAISLSVGLDTADPEGHRDDETTAYSTNALHMKQIVR
jgi:hypothetical protein